MAKVTKYSKEGQTDETIVVASDSIGAASSFNLKPEKIVTNKDNESNLEVSEIIDQLAPISEITPTPEPIPEPKPVVLESKSTKQASSVKESIKSQSTTMPETNPIIIKLEKPAYVKYTMQNTGEESTRIVHDQKVALSRGTIYKLPISNSSLNLQNSYVIRAKEKFADIIRILNVSGGYVTIEPLIHGIVLIDSDEIAVLI